jgi:hypothetical protein
MVMGWFTVKSVITAPAGLSIRTAPGGKGGRRKPVPPRS